MNLHYEHNPYGIWALQDWYQPVLTAIGQANYWHFLCHKLNLWGISSSPTQFNYIVLMDIFWTKLWWMRILFDMPVNKYIWLHIPDRINHKIAVTMPWLTSKNTLSHNGCNPDQDELAYRSIIIETHAIGEIVKLYSGFQLTHPYYLVVSRGPVVMKRDCGVVLTSTTRCF